MRSGTTLLRNLCDSHPDIAITPELNYFFALGKTYTEHRRVLLKRLWEKTFKNGLILLPNLPHYAFAARYLFRMRRFGEKIINVTDIEATLKSIFPKASIVGDKTPGYVFLLDKFVATGRISCLIIYRDCRDVTSSTIKKARTKWSKDQWIHNLRRTENIAKRWVNSIEITERHKDKIHIIRYEDLVREPRQELEALAKWLGVDCSGFSEGVINSIRNKSIGKYKTGLTEEELKIVMEISGPTLARLSYI
jgi:hypothetical protein